MSDPNAGLDDLQMMLAPERWPNYVTREGSEELGIKGVGLLPLKHLDAPHPAGQGVLSAKVGTDGSIVYGWEWKANLWGLELPKPEHTAAGGRELVRLLVQCGWVVD